MGIGERPLFRPAGAVIGSGARAEIMATSASLSRRRTVDDLLVAARARLNRLSPADAHACAARGGLIIDIRSDLQRLTRGLVPGALAVPRNVLEWRADPTCEHRDPAIAATVGPLVLMCAEGYQSSLAAATLHDMGIERATDMIGGFDAWVEAGLPVLPPDRW